MAKMTTRDKIWNVALRKESMHPSEFSEGLEISERTARDTLETMVDMEWLEKTGGEGSEAIEYSTKLNPDPFQ